MRFKTRPLPRFLLRLAVPAVLFALAWSPAPAHAYHYCGDGFYGRYYDDTGELCALNDECDHYHWGTCDRDLSYATANEGTLACICP